MTASDQAVLRDQSFLSRPGEVADWRSVLLVDAAADAGLLGALPGTAADLVDRLGLDETAVRVVLDALAAGEFVVVIPAARTPPGRPHRHRTTSPPFATTLARSAAGAPDSGTGCAA